MVWVIKRLTVRRAPLALLVCMVLHATQMVPLSVEDLTKEAELIVRATVRETTCLRDATGLLRTRVTLDVRDAWKGQEITSPLNVMLVGGTLGERRVVAVGQATYRPGEETVLFLRHNSSGEWVTLGLAQGKFEVWQDSVTGQKYARNLFLGQGATATPNAALQRAGGTSPLSLEELQRKAGGGLK